MTVLCFTSLFPVLLNHSAAVTWDGNRILTMSILVSVGGSAGRLELEMTARLYKMSLNTQDNTQLFVSPLFRKEMFSLCTVIFVETGV
jgi:hypothetical protein